LPVSYKRNLCCHFSWATIKMMYEVHPSFLLT